MFLQPSTGTPNLLGILWIAVAIQLRRVSYQPHRSTPVKQTSTQMYVSTPLVFTSDFLVNLGIKLE